MRLEEIENKLRQELSEKRFVHSVNVMNTSEGLAEIYGIDTGKAALAGLLHDCARDIRGERLFKECEKYGIAVDEVCKRQPQLLHGPLGSKVAGEVYGVTDKEILRAVYYHTTGCEDMDMLTKIVFISDYIEPGRNFPGVEIARELAETDIDRAVLYSLNSTISHILKEGMLLHTETVLARNYLLASGIKQ